MPESLTHAYVTGGDGICDAIDGYLGQAAELVGAATRHQEVLHHQRLQSMVAADPTWSHLAAHIQHWRDEEGHATYGVPNASPAASEATRMEYGDADTAPSALIRMGTVRGASEAGWGLTEAFRKRGY